MAGFFQRFALSLRAGAAAFADPAAGAGFLELIHPGGLGQAPKRHTADFEKGYSQLPWLHAVLSRRADGVGAARWFLYRPSGRTDKLRQDVYRNVVEIGDAERRCDAIRVMLHEGDLDTISNHPLLRLLTGGNAMMTGYDLRRITNIYLDAVGEAIWLLERNAFGVPHEAWAIPPSWLAEAPTADRPTYKFRHLGWDVEKHPADVLWFRRPDPASPYGRGAGQAQSLGDELDADESAARFVAKWFYRDGLPPTVISGEGVKQNSGDPEIRRLEQVWRSKGRLGLPYWLKGQAQVHPIGQTFEQQQIVQLRAALRDGILQSYGMPPELLGILEKSNRSTIGEAERIHARHNLLPCLVRMQATIERLVEQYPGNRGRVIVGFESPVREDSEFKLKVARVARHALTANEWRHLMALPPVEGGDVYVFNSDKVFAVDDLSKINDLRESTEEVKAA